MREVAVVGLFLFMKAQILEQDRLAGLERRDHPSGHITDAIRREAHLLAEDTAKVFGDRLQAEIRRAFLGAPQMRA